LGIDRSLVSTDPDNTKYKINLGYSLSMLGEICENLGRGDEAIAYLRESLEVSREISEADPENAEKLVNFRAANMKIAMTHLAREEFALAVEPMDAVITISRIMIEKGIKVEETREFLTYFEPDVLDTRRKVIAIGAWENLLQQPADELPALLVSRGLVLSNRSQFAEAAEAVEKFMKIDVNNNEQLYDAACVFGRCAASIQAADGGELTPDQSSQRQVWITNAISALEKSIANGWTDRELMMEDADLAILRALPEFMALVQPAETGELQDSNKP
jgi:tetratricopeptide (TPR) repeat protein